jgi:hypothetical protein
LQAGFKRHYYARLRRQGKLGHKPSIISKIALLDERARHPCGFTVRMREDESINPSSVMQRARGSDLKVAPLWWTVRAALV